MLQAAQQQLLEQLVGQAGARHGTARAAADIMVAQKRATAAETALEGTRDAVARVQQAAAEDEVSPPTLDMDCRIWSNRKGFRPFAPVTTMAGASSVGFKTDVCLL